MIDDDLTCPECNCLEANSWYCDKCFKNERKKGVLDFKKWIDKQKKACEKDLMLYADYYNKLLIGEFLIKEYSKGVGGLC